MLANAINRTRIIWTTVMILFVAGSTVGVCPLHAGLGSEISGITTIDTKPPLVAVDSFPEFTLFQGGDTVAFHWQTADDHPGALTEFFTATVMIEGQPQESISYYPDTADFTWEWMVPEVSSANVHVEVLARDEFGMATVDTSNNFTIIASVTDVPKPQNSFRFADPAPNPFNPSTRLSFNLPDEGRVNLTVYDARGHRIRTLLDGSRPAGDFALSWDGRDDAGRAQSGGIYLFVLDYHGSSQSGRISRKAVLIP